MADGLLVFLCQVYYTWFHVSDFFFVIGIVPVIFFNGIGGVVIRTLIFFSVLFFFFLAHLVFFIY